MAQGARWRVAAAFMATARTRASTRADHSTDRSPNRRTAETAGRWRGPRRRSRGGRRLPRQSRPARRASSPGSRSPRSRRREHRALRRLSGCRGAAPRLPARDEGDGERPRALGTVDQRALDVAGCRWTGVKHGMGRSRELGSNVSILYPGHYVGGIEQYHEMLCQVGQRVHHQLIFGKQHGALSLSFSS
jgi:hypothetical protein